MPAPRRPRAIPASIWDEAALTTALEGAGVKAGVHVQKIYKSVVVKWGRGEGERDRGGREHFAPGRRLNHPSLPTSHLLRDPHAHPADTPGLPVTAAALVRQHFVRRTSSLTAASSSSSGGTTKLLLRLADGLKVEAVIMQYDSSKALGRAESGGGGGIRRTLCVSSQAGCAMACTFCATGSMGHLGDLTAAEILEQLDWAAAVVAEKERRGAGVRGLPPIRNVVFMGMGEPLNNYEAVLTAARAMTDSKMFGLRAGGVTISTVGIIPRIRQLATDLPRVSLALSLHAPSQPLRARIVPSARAYPLDRLMAAVEAYQKATSRRVFVEYVLLAGVKDAPSQAAELAALLAGRDVVVNVIPWNPFPPDNGGGKEGGGKSTDAAPEPPELFSAPGTAAVGAFVDVLRAAGLPATVRQEKGQDVAAACGQLALASAGVKQGGGGCATTAARRPQPDMEDLVPPPPRRRRPAGWRQGSRPRYGGVRACVF